MNDVRPRSLQVLATGDMILLQQIEDDLARIGKNEATDRRKRAHGTNRDAAGRSQRSTEGRGSKRVQRHTRSPQARGEWIILRRRLHEQYAGRMARSS